MTDSDPQSTLQKPGAGIPWIARFLGRFVMIPLALRKTPWEQSNAQFQRETEKILKRVSGLGPEQMGKRVLIAPMRGLEDSSRYWSPAMTLEHLMIVQPAMAGLIVLLSQGGTSDRKVDIARVKPQGMLDPAQAAQAFAEAMAQAHRRVTQEVANRDAPGRHAHPWFGPLSCRKWNWLLGVHQRTHRKQIEAILRG